MQAHSIQIIFPEKGIRLEAMSKEKLDHDRMVVGFQPLSKFPPPKMYSNNITYQYRTYGFLCSLIAHYFFIFITHAIWMPP